MDENICYEGVKPLSTDLKYSTDLKTGTDSSSCRKVNVALFLLVLALLLGTVCACIAFAVEISKMKSETASLVSKNDLESKIQNLSQQMSMCYSALDEKIQDLNASSSMAYQLFSQLTQQVNMTTQLVHTLRGQHSSYPTFSCNALPASSPSGYYWILPVTGPPAVQVYCDFNRQCGCDGPGTWTRVAFLNMSDPNQVCPSNWTTYTTPIRACGNGATGSPGCDSVIYPSFGLTYNRVCGRVIAYQQNETIAFATLVRYSYTIGRNYLDGVSITHGSVGSRQHIWSFASAFGDAVAMSHSHFFCSCSSSDNWPYSTSFVGSDYFCDTGYHGSGNPAHTFHSSDPLWDGMGCGPSSTCCTFNNPPWFCKTLSQPTNDDLEVRICDTDGSRDTPIQLMEIYVQ